MQITLYNAMVVDHLVNIPAKYIVLAFGDLEYNDGQVESSFTKVGGRRRCEASITRYLINKVCELMHSIA